MIPGYKPFFETLPHATPATLLPSGSGNHANNEKVPENNAYGSNGSIGSSTPRFENTHNTDSLIERSAIQEYYGELDRDQANLQAAEAYDRQRQSYEFANPDRDPAGVEGLYQAYLSDFVPTEQDPLPAVPPCTRNNTDLWRAWWRVVEEGKNNG